MTLGVYISVPFCRTKCSYCNFASDVFSRAAFEAYVARVVDDISRARQIALQLGCILPGTVDSVYLGGGTPSILEAGQLKRIFEVVNQQFALTRDAEVTVECAPGTLTPELIETLHACRVNRVSLGVQSFVDREARAVGRLHNRDTVVDEIMRLRDAGIGNINLDLIAGLPHQTSASWNSSLSDAIGLNVPHVSVYMLEIDQDSRLGRELIAGGTRYHAHFVPDEDVTADFYVQGCEMLDAAGIAQYEISNFARKEREARHNLKYWTRQPYLGFGVDAHSMLSSGMSSAVRFSTPDSLDAYMNRVPLTITPVTRQAALEECFFLGLRLNRGVDLEALANEFGAESRTAHRAVVADGLREGLLVKRDSTICLTARGRLLSNELFARFLEPTSDVVAADDNRPR